MNKSKSKIMKLFTDGKLEDVFNLLTDEKLKIDKDAELYLLRGNAWYSKDEYGKAISDYSKAIESNPKYTLAYYNRGFAWIAKNNYDFAIADYDTVIGIDERYASAYVIKASILRAKKNYIDAIESYSKAIDIDPNFANAYYNRGLAKKENNEDLESSKKDFEKYIELTANEDDIWIKYAKYYIKYLDVMINDSEMNSIRKLVDNIKKRLLTDGECITHYTGLSILKKLIVDNSKFRISEGNFMNDPSEGDVFFNLIQYTSKGCAKDQVFSPKPFIGSFVKISKCDDLNMWRFYGKEKGLEAQGGAITLRMKDFINVIKGSLPQGEEDFLNNENDINFYKVVYVEKKEKSGFDISGLDKDNELQELMEELKNKVQSYKNDNNFFLEKYLNSIAFLFKNNAYRDESEVRLVVNVLEPFMKIEKDMIPPRVYIEFGSIKEAVEQITLGPKVDKQIEWGSAFYYSYESNAPKIIFSELPYK